MLTLVSSSSSPRTPMWSTSSSSPTTAMWSTSSSTTCKERESSIFEKFSPCLYFWLTNLQLLLALALRLRQGVLNLGLCLLIQMTVLFHICHMHETAR